MSTMFYAFEEINWRWCRHNTVPLSHIRNTVSDGVSRSPRWGGSLPPLNLPLCTSMGRWSGEQCRVYLYAERTRQVRACGAIDSNESIAHSRPSRRYTPASSLCLASAADDSANCLVLERSLSEPTVAYVVRFHDGRHSCSQLIPASCCFKTELVCI